ncbi:MAG: MBL fold metallo-hydrolase [Rhodothermales bacterium]|nr:MBL fold metallo-hydrolase [Rhodothermales bacterium]
MDIQTFTFNPFETNCYVVSDEGRAVVIDPSCREQAEIDTLVSAIRKADLSVERILLTHAHIDHIFGCRAVSDEFGVGIEVHADDVPLLENASSQAAMFGIGMDEPPEPVGMLEPGSTVAVGGEQLRILHTPGHSPGSVTFHHTASGAALAGDVLFRRSIGRTDLWRGSLPILMESIFQVLIPLGESTRILPGHGPETTIGEERAANPFLRDGA